MNTEKASRRGSRDDRQRITRIGDSRGQPLRSARDADWGAVYQDRLVRGKAAAGLVFLAAGAASRLGTIRFRHPDEKTIWLVLFHCYEVTQMRARGSRCVFPGTSCSLRNVSSACSMPLLEKISNVPSGTTLSWQCSRSTTNAISEVLLFCVCVCVCGAIYIYMYPPLPRHALCVCVCVCVCSSIYF
jgi:hypothetical protein